VTAYLAHNLCYRFFRIHVKILLEMMRLSLLDRRQLHVIAKELAQILVIASRQTNL
jgi:hypothetical protein